MSPRWLAQEDAGPIRYRNYRAGCSRVARMVWTPRSPAPVFPGCKDERACIVPAFV
jgi:hypothetical protein